MSRQDRVAVASRCLGASDRLLRAECDHAVGEILNNNAHTYGEMARA